MGCVSSTFLEDDDGAAIGHHIVSLTSTTYGLLTTLDHPPPPPPPPPSPPPLPPPPPPPPPPSSTRQPLTLRSEPEIINSWELMAGLDPTTPIKPPPLPQLTKLLHSPGKENSPSPRALHFPAPHQSINVLRPSNAGRSSSGRYSLDMFEHRCPPGGEHTVVLYTTTLRGVRKTFEECNAVRAALEGLGVWVREKDVSMDLGFREELRRVMAGTGDGAGVPRVFVRGRYIGGAEAVLRIHEEGGLAGILEGLPRVRDGGACDGCGGIRFLPCFRCSGSRKVVMVVVATMDGEKRGGGKQSMVVRCSECNENGLVLCPICF